MTDNVASYLSYVLRCKLGELPRYLKGPTNHELAELVLCGKVVHLTYNNKKVACRGMSTLSAREQPAYGKHYLKVSVAQHFFVKHKIDLKYPDLPCLIVATPTKAGGVHHEYYPMELGMVVPDLRVADRWWLKTALNTVPQSKLLTVWAKAMPSKAPPLSPEDIHLYDHLNPDGTWKEGAKGKPATDGAPKSNPFEDSWMLDDPKGWMFDGPKGI